MTKRILLASAHVHHLDLYTSVLSNLGYEILKVTSAADAIQSSIHYLPSLIICIEGLADIDLKSFCKILHTNTVLRSMPLMVVSPAIDFDQCKKMALGTQRIKVFAKLEKDQILFQTLKFAKEVSNIVFINTDVEKNLFNPYKAAESIQRFESHASIKKFNRKEILFSEGSKSTHLYYIRSGQVMTSSMNSTGKVFIHSIFCMGDFFGSQPHITNGINIRTATATSDCEVYMVPANIFKEEINNNIEFMKAFISWQGKFLIGVEKQILTMALSSVRKRLASVLIRLYRKTPSDRIKITRENLARISGTVKETAIRTLSDFKQEGLIDIKNADIIILDAYSLKKIAD